MKVDLQEARFIDIFADENNNIVIFPYSKSNIPVESQGTKIVGNKFAISLQKRICIFNNRF
ncbi:MAG: hypothetical protein LUC92_06940 [Clostridiales bacterium]|nr:hypothetical protein [Clostridiales bacterium]